MDIIFAMSFVFIIIISTEDEPWTFPILQCFHPALSGNTSAQGQIVGVAKANKLLQWLKNLVNIE